MKRIVASLGMAALGAACVGSANAQSDPSKPWSASVALRGFYDDNLNTAPQGGKDTFGFEVSPTLALSYPGDQTTASIAYTYTYKYYDHKPAGSLDNDDQTHNISASLQHSFSERTSVSVADSFVIGQEPDVLAVGYSGFTSPQRISGDNIRNYASLIVNHQFTRTFGIEAGYANSFFDYADDQADHFGGAFAPGYPLVYDGFGNPVGVQYVSHSGLLDRVEHRIHLDTRWLLSEQTIFIAGYEFGMGCYTGDEPIGVLLGDLSPIFSSSRDYRSHTAYIGLDHTFRPDFTGSIRGGLSYYDYYKSPDKETAWSPYAKANLRYTYAQNSYFEIGGSHDRSATDVNSIDQTTGSVTTSGETTVGYASLTHRILPDLTGSLMGTFQNVQFEGGTFDGKCEQYYLFSASLEYQINRHLSATASYHFDHLESSIPISPGNDTRSYNRNRVFLGAVLTY